MSQFDLPPNGARAMKSVIISCCLFEERCRRICGESGVVTDRQTCADSVCYQTVNKYVKVRTNEHMK